MDQSTEMFLSDMATVLDRVTNKHKPNVPPERIATVFLTVGLTMLEVVMEGVADEDKPDVVRRIGEHLLGEVPSDVPIQ